MRVSRREKDKALEVENIEENEEIFTFFLKSIFLENVKLILMIHVFLILRIL